MSAYSLPTDPNQNFRRPNGNPTTRRRRLSISQGRLAQPSRVISKAEREQREQERKDSVIDAEEEREAYERSWRALGDKIASSIWVTQGLRHLDQTIANNFAPACSATLVPQFWSRQRIHNLRSLIVSVLLLLACFGALWSVIEYLLLVTRASACSVSTVYIPVPYTVTVGGDGVSSSAPASSSFSYTSTTTQVFVSTITVNPPPTSVTALSSSAAPTYFYTVDPEGHTSWVNGLSPSPGAQLTTATTSIFMVPVPSTSSADSDPGKLALLPAADPPTITPVAYTSTTYSYIGPDLTSTSTSTSTHYVTYTVSEPTASGASLSTTRTSFQGVSSGGWNATGSTDPNQTGEVVETADPVETTLTATYFFGTGTETTSTSTTHITTTVALRYTVTVPPQGQSINGHGTGLPITLTPGTAFSTSIAESPIASTAGSSLASPGPGSPGLSSSTPSQSSPAATPHITTTWSNYGTGISYPTGSGGSLSITYTYSAGGLNTTESSTSRMVTMGPGPISLSSITSATTKSSASALLTVAPGPVSLSSTTSAPTLASTGHSPPRPLLSTGSGSPVNPASGSTNCSSSSSVSRSMTTTTRTKSSSATSSISSSSKQSLSRASNSTSIPGTSAATPRLSSSSTFSSSSGGQSFTISGQSSSNVRASTTSSSSFSNPFPASSATAAPSTGCGEHGNFMLGFDDLPSFTPSNPNATDITHAPPIFSPYHHLTFSGGYVYAPQPHEPFPPISPPHLAVYLADESGMTAKAAHPGEIGDGPRDSISAFWFDAYSAYMGCDNPGPGPCTMVFSGYTWNPTANDEVLAYTQNQTLPNCHDFIDCHLQKVEFPPAFRGLTGLQIQAFIGNQQRIFFMDNLALGWSNNSCAAGLQRQASQ